MRFVYSILCILGVALLFGWNAQAHDLVGGLARDLKSASLDASSAKYLSELCEKEGHYIVPPTIGNCKKIIDNSKLTQSTFNYCMDSSKSKSMPFNAFVECVDQVQGKDYPLSYIKACEKVRAKGNYPPLSSQKVCLEYLANSKAGYDSEAYALCMKINEYDFRHAKSCLNAIRDRNIDVQLLERECLKDGKAHAESNSCIEKLTDTMPSETNCAPNRAQSSGASASGIGTR